MFKSLVPTLSVVTAIIIVMFFTKPIFEEAKETKVTVDAYKETIEEYRNFIDDLRRLEGQRSSVAVVSQARLNQMLTEEIDVPQLLVNLESLAEENKMFFGNISAAEGLTESRSNRVNALATNAPTAIDGLVSQSITFEVIGTYEQFKNFLRQVESSLTLMEITSINLSGATSRFQQYSLTVEVYSLPNN